MQNVLTHFANSSSACYAFASFCYSLHCVLLHILFVYVTKLGFGGKIHIYASTLRLFIIWLSPELGGRKGILAIDVMIKEVVDYRQDEAQGGPVDTVRAAHSCSMRQAPQDCCMRKCAPRLSLCIADFSKATRSPGTAPEAAPSNVTKEEVIVSDDEEEAPPAQKPPRKRKQGHNSIE